MIPTIDLRDFDVKSAKGQSEAKKLLDAYTTYGFAYIQHGIPQEKVDKAFKQAKAFMRLPEEVKAQVLRPRNGRDARGWTPPGGGVITQDVYDKKALDQIKAATPQAGAYEFYILGKSQHPYLSNRLPPEDLVPDFFFVLSDFVEECVREYRNLLKAFALALGTIPPDWFEQYHTYGTEHLYLNHYIGGLYGGSQPRLNTHTDYGYLVLLFQDQVGGLEVKDPMTSEFVPVPPKTGTLVANVGDMLHRWSNGLLKSTYHRVIPPKPFRGEDGQLYMPERFSLPFAGSPDVETIVDVIPGCISDLHPRQFEPINGQDWIEKRQGTQYA